MLALFFIRRKRSQSGPRNLGSYRQGTRALVLSTSSTSRETYQLAIFAFCIYIYSGVPADGLLLFKLVPVGYSILVS